MYADRSISLVEISTHEVSGTMHDIEWLKYQHMKFLELQHMQIYSFIG